MKHYKVVVRHDIDKLISYNYLFNKPIGEQKHIVTYEPGKWAKAHPFLAERNLHLFVFDNLKSAHRFIRTRTKEEGIEIWECHIRKKHDKLPIYMNGQSLSVLKLRPDAWIEWFPDDTVMVEQVKLIRRVDNDENNTLSQ